MPGHQKHEERCLCGPCREELIPSKHMLVAPSGVLHLINNWNLLDDPWMIHYYYMQLIAHMIHEYMNNWAKRFICSDNGISQTLIYFRRNSSLKIENSVIVNFWNTFQTFTLFFFFSAQWKSVGSMVFQTPLTFIISKNGKTVLQKLHRIKKSPWIFKRLSNTRSWTIPATVPDRISKSSVLWYSCTLYRMEMSANNWVKISMVSETLVYFSWNALCLTAQTSRFLDDGEYQFYSRYKI